MFLWHGGKFPLCRVAIIWCWLTLGPTAFFLLFAFASWGETQIWLGDLRVVCRFAAWFFCSVFCFRIATSFLSWNHCVSLIRLICLHQFQNRALERHRPCQRRKKKGLWRTMATSISPPSFFIIGNLFLAALTYWYWNPCAYGSRQLRIPIAPPCH